jgi:hypothetical protein
MAVTGISGGVPLMDFSEIGNLRKTYDDARTKAVREQTLAELGQGAGPIDYDAAARKLMSVDPQMAMTIATLGRNAANDQWQRTYQGGMLDVARQGANKPQIVDVGTPDGRRQKMIVDPSSGKQTPLGSPMGDDVKLTSTDRKAIFEAEDENANLKTTRAALERAKELAPAAFTGYLSSARATVGNNLPDGLVPDFIASKGGSEATTELSQILSEQSITNMSKTLKGASTDREMAEFKRIQADPNVPVKLKQAAIDRMLQKVELQEKINTDRVNQLRGGTYFKPTGGQSQVPQAAAAALIADPSKRDEFDAKFGPGSAARVLGR